ncbi:MULTISPECIES: response regulator [Streptomyces]|uniref:Response regulator transcription factor n=1 Tax=Streptomyces anulatus TaxID=1892 RepID=A0A7K3RDA2_STRAQ|nr:response regulator transcription factor [Streptomyces sp. MNU77]NEB99966.1 response regulator transcription factor [Streptomyces anulatus]NED23616.1 response regulator transcription factor [Streptomyces anulatus]OLO33288.1 DNA-binding response regulator [Streptomyces sp. MNU77]
MTGRTDGPAEAAATVRVVLADDQTVVRAGFRALLDLTDDLVVVAEAADGARAVEAVRTTRPDVVLMDVRMPGVDGLEATRRIAEDRSLDRVRVVMLTTYQVDAYVFEALRYGAAGFLLKDIEPDDLRAAIRTVAAGRSLLAPAVTRRVIEEFARLKAPEAAGAERLAVLTGREREVMALVAAGLSNEEIGRALIMSPLTAKTHVSRTMTKLGARDRAQLVVLAYETGLVRAGEG